MLGLAKRVKARILLASTSEIYGDPEVHPQPEVSSYQASSCKMKKCFNISDIYHFSFI
jgi:UDP-glucuronate decarboxylase